MEGGSKRGTAPQPRTALQPPARPPLAERGRWGRCGAGRRPPAAERERGCGGIWSSSVYIESMNGPSRFFLNRTEPGELFSPP